MYLIGFPLLLIPLAIYNIIAFLFRSGFSDVVFTVAMLSGATLDVTTGDVLVIFAILLLFIEILKATRFGMKSIIDHMLSFVVFAAALAEFIMVSRAATPTFLLLLALCVVDVVGGLFSGSIRTARRDLAIERADPVQP